MIREDYILRMINQLAQALAKMIFNKEIGNYQEALDNIASSFTTILGLDYVLFNSVSANDIITLLDLTDDPFKKNMSCIVLAKLFKEQADIKYLGNWEDTSVLTDYQKSLSLYLEGFLNTRNLEPELYAYAIDIREILDKLNDYDVSSELREKLVLFFELIETQKE